MATAVPELQGNIATLRRIEREAASPPAPERGDGAFRHAPEQEGAEGAWAFTAMPGLAALIVHLVGETRKDVFRGVPVDPETLATAREAATAWLRVSEGLRERAERYLRHHVGGEQARSYLATLRGWQADVKQAMVELAAQRSARLPIHRFAAPGGGQG